MSTPRYTAEKNPFKDLIEGAEKELEELMLISPDKKKYIEPRNSLLEEIENLKEQIKNNYSDQISNIRKKTGEILIEVDNLKEAIDQKRDFSFSLLDSIPPLEPVSGGLDLDVPEQQQQQQGQQQQQQQDQQQQQQGQQQQQQGQQQQQQDQQQQQQQDQQQQQQQDQQQQQQQDQQQQQQGQQQQQQDQQQQQQGQQQQQQDQQQQQQGQQQQQQQQQQGQQQQQQANAAAKKSIPKEARTAAAEKLKTQLQENKFEQKVAEVMIPFWNNEWFKLPTDAKDDEKTATATVGVPNAFKLAGPGTYSSKDSKENIYVDKNGHAKLSPRPSISSPRLFESYNNLIKFAKCQLGQGNESLELGWDPPTNMGGAPNFNSMEALVKACIHNKVPFTFEGELEKYIHEHFTPDQQKWLIEQQAASQKIGFKDVNYHIAETKHLCETVTKMVEQEKIQAAAADPNIGVTVAEKRAALEAQYNAKTTLVDLEKEVQALEEEIAENIISTNKVVDNITKEPGVLNVQPNVHDAAEESYAYSLVQLKDDRLKVLDTLANQYEELKLKKAALLTRITTNGAALPANQNVPPPPPQQGQPPVAERVIEKGKLQERLENAQAKFDRLDEKRAGVVDASAAAGAPRPPFYEFVKQKVTDEATSAVGLAQNFKDNYTKEEKGKLATAWDATKDAVTTRLPGFGRIT